MSDIVFIAHEMNMDVKMAWEQRGVNALATRGSKIGNRLRTGKKPHFDMLLSAVIDHPGARTSPGHWR